MLQNNNNQRGIIHFRRGFVLFAAVLLLLAILSGCGKKKDDVATYKGGTVTKAQFATYLGDMKMIYPQYAPYLDNASFQDQILNQMIAYNIMQDRAGGKIDQSTINDAQQELASMKQSYESAQAGLWSKELKEYGVTEADVQAYLAQMNYVQNSVASKITDQQIKDEYDSDLKADPHAYDIATVSHILISLTDSTTGQTLRTKEEALARAQDVEKQLKAGGDFAALAKQYSDDPGSKDNGGTYENAPVSQWVDAFKQAVISLPLNTISDPVETEYGYHIIKVESRSTQTLDQVKDTVKSNLAQKQMSDFMDNELPGLIISKNLPTPSQSPGAPAAATIVPDTGDSGTAAPEPSPSLSPLPSPSATAGQ